METQEKIIDSISLDISTTNFLNCESGAVTNYFVKINYGDYVESLKLIGEVNIKLINQDSEYYEGFDTFDEEGHQYGCIYNAIFDEYGEVKDDLYKNLEGVAFSQYLIIGNIKLDAEYRLKGIGSAIIKNVLDYLSGFESLVLLKSFPLEFEGNKNKKGLKQAQKNLNTFYSKNNFLLEENEGNYIFYKEA
jgi:GNAT superfamily N-acetyltransferase